MTQDSTQPGQPTPPSPFEAAVDAAFASAVEGGGPAKPDAVAALRDLIALLREAPLERPSNAMRSRAERLVVADGDARRDLASLLRLWLQAARQVAMELVGPGSADGGLLPSMAGFRGAAAPIRTYRAAIEATPSTTAMETWLDLQVDPVPQGSRLRGQITCEADVSPSMPVMVHLLDRTRSQLLASAPIAADGTFVIATDAAEVTIAIELDRLDTALVVGSLVLRT